MRHHGPGCARSLRAALEELAPNIVLVEGPPEGDALLRFLPDAALRPPVALLVYRPDLPRRASFFPLAVFSPEWQALSYAAEHGVPARFCDLPQAVDLARDPPALSSEAGEDGAEDEPAALRDDPIGALAAAAGYAEGELWWEEEIERRHDARDLFAAILEAMAELRAAAGEEEDEHERRREAWMRRTIHAAEREGFERIAVVCGAWHAPLLTARAAGDAALLRGLPRTKVEATWIPWTHRRLARTTGYGAGLTSPGWYHHLWTARERSTSGWIAAAAHLLRSERLDAPASGVIDAVRLAETLAALRERRQPGLTELRESIQTVLCAGELAPLELIRTRLEVGEVMGGVPAGAPAVPLQRDVEAQQRRLRVKPSESAATLDLDLRQETDRARSVLLHRLRALEIPWGTLARTQAWAPARRSGTFHEVWQTQWHMEFPLLLIERNVWGNTLLDAAEAYVRRGSDEDDLPRLTARLQEAVMAELPAAVAYLLERIGAQSAVTTDTRLLVDAILPLAQVARYGDVRGTASERVAPILDVLFERALVGLPGACAGLDDAAAAQLLESLVGLHESINLLDRAAMRAAWSDLLHGLAYAGAAHPLIRGWSCRQLFEGKLIDPAELERLAALALSRGAGAAEGASWIEGLLRGPGLVLLHEDGLWMALDGWLQELDGSTFTETLPLLRRAFAGFQSPERRAMGEKLRRLRAGAPAQAAPLSGEPAPPIARERAGRVVPTLAGILGIDGPHHEPGTGER